MAELLIPFRRKHVVLLYTIVTKLMQRRRRKTSKVTIQAQGRSIVRKTLAGELELVMVSGKKWSKELLPLAHDFLAEATCEELRVKTVLNFGIIGYLCQKDYLS